MNPLCALTGITLLGVSVVATLAALQHPLPTALGWAATSAISYCLSLRCLIDA